MLPRAQSRRIEPRAGCQPAHRAPAYRTSLDGSFHGRAAAGEANRRGLGFIAKSDYESAETAFREALAADLTYPTGHNNLGLVLMKKSRLHGAALEFSYAIRLDKRAVEPVINLGRLYEAVDWADSAIDQYKQALALDSLNTDAMGRLACIYAASGTNPVELESLLYALAQSQGNVKWQSWARAELASAAGSAGR